jgi:hypothetical protein
VTHDHALVLGGIHIGKLLAILHGWTDPDWASSIDTQKSVSGYTFSLGGGVISWNSKKQAAIATLSCETKYVAVGHSMKDALWLRNLLKELGYQQHNAMIINGNNIGAISLTKDAVFHARSKHIDIQHHFIQEHVGLRDVTFIYILSAKNTADLFTKALP